MLAALANIATSSALAGAGIGALVIALVPSRRHILPRHLAVACAAGLVALALDEGIELHDRAGRWLYHERGVVAPGPVNHVDDLFVIGYMVAGVAIMAAYLPALWRSRRLFAGLVMAGALIAIGTAFDALGTTGTWTDFAEEAFETAGAVVLAVAFLGEAFGTRQLASVTSHLSESREQPSPKGGAHGNDDVPQPDPQARLPAT